MTVLAPALAGLAALALAQSPVPTPPALPPDAASPTPHGVSGIPALVTLSLAEALEELDRQNTTLEESRARAQAALGVVRQVAAPLLPTLQAQGSYFHNNTSVIFAAPSGGALERIYLQPLDAWQGGGTLRVPLIVPDSWFLVSSARDAALAAASGTEATRLTVRAALVQSAWTVWAGDRIVEASERAVTDAREQAESARRQVLAGTATKLNVLQAESSLSRRESDLVQARSDRARARIALGVLLGRPSPVHVTLPQLPPATSQDVARLSEEALANRPEITATAAVVRSYEKQSRAAAWRIAPQISASASGSGQTVPYPTGDQGAWRVSVDLTWTLYDGGFRYGKMQQADAQASEARAAETGARLQILQEVQNAARDVEVARARLALAQAERATASEAAASARRGFQEGVTSSLDVLAANETLYMADVQVAGAGGRLGASLAALDRAVGRSP